MISDEKRLFFYVTENQIYKHYFGDIVLGKKYQSVLRSDDPTPSLVFFVSNESDKIRWKDFGMNLNGVKDAIFFVQTLKNFEGHDLDRKDTINLIFEEMVLSGNTVKVNKIKQQPSIDYSVSWGELNDFEMEYWMQFHLYRDDLLAFNIKGVRGYYKNNKFIRNSTPNDPMFVYLTPNRDIFKVYRPLAKDKSNKFRGQGNGNVIEGYESLPKTGSLLLHNSSLKDTAVIRKAGYFGCNSTSETVSQALFSRVREFNGRFERNIIFFDNDKPGIEAARKLSYNVGWEFIHLPYGYPKDPADLVLKTGNYYELKRFLNNKLC